MARRSLPEVTVRLDKIVGGGQTLGQMEDGKKLFVWGGLPGEQVKVQLTKSKSSYSEGIVTEVLEASAEREEPKDPASFLSTSPWQIMSFDAEQHYKAALIEEAFELHDIVLPEPITLFSDDQAYHYRNKVEFSWWWDNDTNELELAFFKRGSHTKQPVDGTSLAADKINTAAIAMRDLLRKHGTEARSLKTLLIRSTKKGEIGMQLYVKDETFPLIKEKEIAKIPGVVHFETIYSNPKSPASVITKRLQQWGTPYLEDTVYEVSFHYAVEGFFQINLPVYEQALKDMKQWIEPGSRVVDLYSGVGTIGLTIGGDDITLVEVNEHAVREMQRTIKELGREDSAHVVLAASEAALETIQTNATIIVDPPRAGLHTDVIKRLLETKPSRIIYLSCNPVTQARDVMMLAESYGIRAHSGYNFFPRTPHIEHLVVLDLKKTRKKLL